MTIAEESRGTGTKTVLLVQETAPERASLCHRLERLGYRVVDAERGPDGLRAISAAEPDVVLLNVLLPGLDGWGTLGRIREVSEVPIIMLTPRSSEVERIRGLRAGADDIIGKPFDDVELSGRIESVLRRASTVHGDALTRLANRRAFDEQLESLLGSASPDEQLSLVLLDVDGLARVNEVEGRAAGDDALRAIARIALRYVRADEEVYRVGGQRFAVLVRGAPDAAVRVAERVREAVREAPELLPTLSAGIAGWSDDGRTGAELLAAADVALRVAKREAGDTVVPYDPSLTGDAEDRAPGP